MPELPLHLQFIIATIVAAAISIYAVRKTMFIAQKMKIYDVPDKIRKIHGDGIPSLGGIGIFIGYIIVAVFFWQRQDGFIPPLLASSVLLFFTGIYDDLVNMSPVKKLLAQLAASFIAAFFAGISIAPFFGLFDLVGIPYRADVILTTLACTFFINVFNFIDGIDGLAAMLGMLYLGIIAWLFCMIGEPDKAGISFALLGATGGLLVYNRPPAKIYMGDTGSMFLGFTIFIFTLFITNKIRLHGVDIAVIHLHGFGHAAVLAIAMLFVPIYDGIRVFAVRASKGISPLKADRVHLHYYLLDAGFSHGMSVGIIVCLNILLLMVAYLMQDVQPLVTLAALTVFTSVVVWGISIVRKRKLGRVG